MALNNPRIAGQGPCEVCFELLNEFPYGRVFHRDGSTNAGGWEPTSAGYRCCTGGRTGTGAPPDRAVGCDDLGAEFCAEFDPGGER